MSDVSERLLDSVLFKKMQEAQKHVTYGGGSGYHGGMEERVTRLEILTEQHEKLFGEIRDSMKSLDERTIRIDERLKHVPTMWSMTITMVSFTLTIIAVFAAVASLL